MTQDNVRDSKSGVAIDSTGTIITLDSGVRGRPLAGWEVSGTAAADYRVDIRVDGIWFTGVASYSSSTAISDGQTLPEADAIRINVTSAATAGATADVAIGVDE